MMTTPEDVLAFWFPDGDTPERERHVDLWIWRMRGGAHDEVIARFSDLTERAASGALDHWAGTALGRLALIVVLDQFSRSVWAGTPRAFAQDRKALALCLEGLGNGHFDALPNAWFKTVYKLPLEHCECPEHLANLDRAVAIARRIAAEAPEHLRQGYERGAEMPALHRDVIAAFGRHPHRNAVLGRTSTPAEIAYLDKGDFPHQRDLRAHLKRD
jgi:uncharacterized protein (DUF924 family)